MVDLFCAVVGDGRIFPVEIDLNKSVGHLKEAINPGLSPFDAAQIKLYLARRGDTWVKGRDDDMVAVARGEIPDTIMALMADEMKPFEELSADEYFGQDFTPGKGDIHVLVDLPKPRKRSIQELGESPPGSLPSSRARTASVDASAQWLEQFHASAYGSNVLPARTALGEFVGSALPGLISLDRSVYEKVDAIVDKPVMDKMFVLNEHAPCRKLWDKIVAFTLNPVYAGGTENAYIGYWDSNIRQPLQTLFAQGRINRDTCHSTSTGTKRPDFMFELDQMCVFRGEEKNPEVHINIPRKELSDKLEWTYGDQVPYVLGYATSGYECALYAIYYDSEALEVRTQELGMYKTDDTTRRFEFLLGVLQLSRLFRGIVHLCPAAAKREFEDIARSNGVIVRLNVNSVVKDFSNFKADNKFAIDSRALVRTYNQLHELKVPRMDRLDHVSSSGHELTFKPRGLEMKPCSLEELFIALECVLTALEVLHKAGWMHRDIRWPNVMKYKGSNPGWFLIDFADAASSPQTFPSGTHLSRAGHAPEIFVEGGEHTTAVDMWNVGRLIDEWDGQMVWQFSPARNHFMVSLLHSDPTKRPTAAQALKQLEQLKESSL
jgi:hypothetical protein